MLGRKICQRFSINIPSLATCSIGHAAMAGSCCEHDEPGAAQSPGLCPKTHVLHTEIPKLRPPTTSCPVSAGGEAIKPIPSTGQCCDWWVPENCPSAIRPLSGLRWVVGDHLNKNTDSILARTHHRLIWTEKCQLRHQMSKNLEITSEEEPVCKQKIFTLQNLVRLTSLRLNVHHSICKW